MWFTDTIHAWIPFHVICIGGILLHFLSFFLQWAKSMNKELRLAMIGSMIAASFYHLLFRVKLKILTHFKVREFWGLQR